MPRVMVKGFGEVDLPDGMSQEQMRLALRQMYPTSARQSATDALTPMPSKPMQVEPDMYSRPEVSLRDYLTGVGDTAESFARGAAQGSLGVLGDLQDLGQSAYQEVTSDDPSFGGFVDRLGTNETIFPTASDVGGYIDSVFGENKPEVLSQEGADIASFGGELIGMPLGAAKVPAVAKAVKDAPISLLDAVAQGPSARSPLSQRGMIAMPVLDEMKSVRSTATAKSKDDPSKRFVTDKGLLDLTADDGVSFADKNIEVRARILDPLRKQAMGGFTTLGEKADVLNPGTPKKYKKPQKGQKVGGNITENTKLQGKPFPYGKYKIKPINIYSMPGEYKSIMNEVGMSVPRSLMEVGADEAGKFIKHLNDAKSKSKYSAAVETHTEDYYKNTRMFLTEDGKSGFALNGDDIVSVFSDGTHKGISPYLMVSAIDLGGRKLDNFDDALTKLYSAVGFRQSANLPFNKEFAPEGWDFELMGEPDVTSMYQSASKAEPQFGGTPVDDYDELMRVRDSDLAQQPSPIPTEISYVPLDVSQIGNRLKVSSPDATPYASKGYQKESLKDISADFTIPREIPDSVEINPERLEGGLLRSSGYDQMSNNRVLESINGKPLAFPVEMQGGQDYLIDDRTRGALAVLDDDMAGSSQNKMRQAIESSGVDDIYFAPFVMGREGVDFSKDPMRAMISYNAANMTKKGKKMFDSKVRKVFKDFAGISDQDPRIGLAQIENLNSEKRKKIFKETMMQDMVGEGGITPEAIRFVVADPSLVNKRKRELHNVSRIDPYADRVPSAHDTYQADAIPGDYVGTLNNVRLDNLLNPIEMPQNPLWQKNRGLLDIIEQGGFHRAVELSQPVSFIDDKQLRFNEMRMNDPETPISELYKLHGIKY